MVMRWPKLGTVCVAEVGNLFFWGGGNQSDTCYLCHGTFERSRITSILCENSELTILILSLKKKLR